MQGLAAGPIRRLRHDGQGDALLPEQSLVAGDEFNIRAAMGLQVDDHHAGPFAARVCKRRGQKSLAGCSRVEMPDFRSTMSQQHAGQQVRGMPIIINQRDERGIVGNNVQ